MTSKAARPAPPCRIWFDAAKGEYWGQLEPDRFTLLSWSDVKLHCRAGHLPWPATGDEDLTTDEKSKVTVQRNASIDFVGRLGGHRTGRFVTSAGLRVLVTSECNAWRDKPRDGDCSTWEAFLGDLLPDGQLDWFVDWLAVAYRSLLKGDFAPGQMVVLAGEPGCGKSLCQTLVTEVLGGRSASPYQYMTGQTAFNGHVSEAEHLAMADVAAATDIRSRRAFGESVKELCVNLELNVHAKGRQAINLPTFRRLSLSVNDEPENLSILPPWDDSIADKVHLFRCAKARVNPDRCAAWRSFVTELPAFRALLARWRVPAERSDQRFGVRAYHHSDLVQSISDLAPETRLLALIDDLHDFTLGPMVATAGEIERQLRGSQYGFAVDRLLSFSSACGVYLQRLTRTGRVKSEKAGGKTTWTITAL